MVEVVDSPKSYQVDVFCVDYSSNQSYMWLRSNFLSYPLLSLLLRTVTCGYEVIFYLIPLLSLLLGELYHLVSLPR
jgi:hypothetical protein